MRILFGLTIQATLACVVYWAFLAGVKPLIWIAGIQMFGMIFMMAPSNTNAERQHQYERIIREEPMQEQEDPEVKDHWAKKTAKVAAAGYAGYKIGRSKGFN